MSGDLPLEHVLVEALDLLDQLSWLTSAHASDRLAQTTYGGALHAAQPGFLVASGGLSRGAVSSTASVMPPEPVEHLYTRAISNAEGVSHDPQQFADAIVRVGPEPEPGDAKGGQPAAAHLAAPGHAVNLGSMGSMHLPSAFTMATSSTPDASEPASPSLPAYRASPSPLSLDPVSPSIPTARSYQPAKGKSMLGRSRTVRRPSQQVGDGDFIPAVQLTRSAVEAEDPLASLPWQVKEETKSEALGSNTGLKLWTGNKSKAEVPRLGVRLIQARGLAGPDGQDGTKHDPYASVKCEKTCFKTRAETKTQEPLWDEFFVFEVLHPSFAVLRIKIYDKMRCWRPRALGEVRIAIKSISDLPAKYAQPMWHTLRSHKGGAAKGQVQLQLYYLSMRVHRPLNVMCCTWNVGNEAPPDNLSPWLRGVDKLEHDIVAIGVQECTYRLKDITTRGSVEMPEDDEGPDPDTDCGATTGDEAANPRRQPSRKLDHHQSISSPDASMHGSQAITARARLARNLSRTFTPGHNSALTGSRSLSPQHSRSLSKQLSGAETPLQPEPVASGLEQPAQRLAPAGPVAEGLPDSFWGRRQSFPGKLDIPASFGTDPGGSEGGTPPAQQILATPTQASPSRLNPSSSPGFSPKARVKAQARASLQFVPSIIEPTDSASGLETEQSMQEMFTAGVRTQAKRADTDGLRGNIRDVWEDHLKEAMGPHYWMVRSMHMGQMRLVVFARNDVVAGVGDVTRGSQATGVAGVATNKGGVAIALKVWDTDLCFVNCHLAAHQDKCTARNNNYKDIVRGIRMDGQQMDMLTAYHHVFWMGDLNYRLDYGSQATNPTDSPLPSDFHSLVSDIDAQKYPELLSTCQLRREMKEQRAFLGFSEPEIHFAPTFKVDRRKWIHYKMQRSPAWCDRVLYRSNLPLKQVRPSDYFSVPEISTSDHKPVGAIFSVPTIWKQDEEGSEDKPVVLVITLLAAQGLFMLRQRKGPEQVTPAGVNSLPCPKLIFKGACLQDAAGWESSVVKHSRDPTWVGPTGPPTLGSRWSTFEHSSEEINLKRAPLQDLANRRIMVRVVDVGEGKMVSGPNTLARGVLCLTAPAMQLLQSSGPASLKACKVTVPLEYNGVPAGTLEVGMALQVNKASGSEQKSMLKRMSKRFHGNYA